MAPTKPAPTTTRSIPTSMRTGPPKPRDDTDESAKRLELIKAARSNKRKVDISPRKDSRDVAKKSEKSEMKATLPLMIKYQEGGKKKKVMTYTDADEDFYRDFKIIWVALPVTADELPRESGAGTLSLEKR